MALHQEAFDEALRPALSDKQPLAWRAAALLCNSIKPNDARVRAYLKRIVSFIPVAQDNQKRELLRICYGMELSAGLMSQLYSHAIEIWKDINKDPSIRINALKMLCKIVNKYPELTGEVLLLRNEYFLSTFPPPSTRCAIRLFASLK